MKLTITKIIALIFVLIMYSQLAEAQLRKSRTETIQEFGNEYRTGIADDVIPYISYSFEKKDEIGRIYTKTISFYFTNDDICVYVQIQFPISKINAVIEEFNGDYVKIGDMKWKDYETNTTYKIRKVEINGYKFCVVDVFDDNFYDNSK